MNSNAGTGSRAGPRSRSLSRLLLTTAILLPLIAFSARAETYVVTKYTDSAGDCEAEDCSLREAINAANDVSGQDTVRLPPGTYRLSLAGEDSENEGANGDLDILDDLELIGANPAVTVIDGGGIGRALQIGDFNNNDFDVDIEGLTIRNGNANGLIGGGILNNGRLALDRVILEDNESPDQGGGIYNNGTAEMSNCILRGNHSDDGGAVFAEGGSQTSIRGCLIADNTAGASAGGINNNGNLSIIYSALVDNTAQANGGGIFNNVEVLVEASTISGNVAGNRGGGIDNLDTIGLASVTIANNEAPQGAGIANDSGNELTLTNTLLADNGDENCSGEDPLAVSHSLEDADDCDLRSIDPDNSLVDTDPLLEPLAANDGLSPAPTHALALGSPAIDAGDNGDCDTFDQRGAPRERDGDGDDVAVCDIGAYEWNPVFVVDSTADAADADPDDDRCRADGGECTLRAAIQQANQLAGLSVIEVPAGEYRLTLTGAGEDSAATGDLDLRQFITLRGEGADRTVIDGNGTDRVFDLRFLGAVLTEPSVPVQRPGARLLDLTVRGGAVQEDGGGIRTNSPLELRDSVVEGNEATGSGGGIHSDGDGALLIVNTTLRDNRADSIGGGIRHEGSGPVYIEASLLNGNAAGAGASGGGMEATDAIIRNSTISGNTAFSGAGLFLFGVSALIHATITDNEAGDDQPGGVFPVGRTRLAATIVAGNRNEGGIRNCASPGSVLTAGANVEDLDSCGLDSAIDLPNNDPLLAPLADNGGPTLTHALGDGSPAIDPDTGTSALADLCPSADQRGAPRPVDGGSGNALCDSGAYEFAATPPSEEPDDDGSSGGGFGAGSSGGGAPGIAFLLSLLAASLLWRGMGAPVLRRARRRSGSR